MFKKSFNLLRNNSVLIMLYAGYSVLTIIFLIFYIKDLSQISNANPVTFNLITYVSAMVRILIYLLLMCVLGLLFFSGYGNMVTEAVIKGKTSMASFLPGIKKYIVRILLAMLLVLAFSIVLSIVFTLIMMPIVFLQVTNESISINNLSIIFVSITAVIAIFSLPFVIFWFPAIFIDDTKVIKGLSNGAKAGLRIYWKLVLILFIIYLPAVVNVVINYDNMTKGVYFTPGYLLMYILSSIITIIALPAIFILYNENKRTVIDNKEAERLI